ncbi:MAG: pectin acetylesterase-family hydrolase [Minicystis sp.]
MRARAWQCFALVVPCALGCGNAGVIDTSTSGAGGTGGVITGAGGGSAGGGFTTHPTSSVASTSGTGGAGGSEPVCPPTPPVAGPPLNAPDGQWTWVTVGGAVCRDGSPAGVGVRLHPNSKKLFIYLEGGGACFNGTTCAISLASFGKLAFDGWAGTVGQTGIFNDANPENPVKGWNAIYVPYCSGDVHAGDAADVDVSGGPQNQDFVGYRNMGAYLGRIVPTFPELTQVLLTGISAGGFGAAFNYNRVAAAFCPTPVTLVDDSGPPMADAYLAPCLQEQWRGLWNLKKTLPADCSACSDADGGGIVNYVPYLAQKWPNSYLGLISSTRDSVISTFFGFGTSNCTQSLPIPGDVYAAGLEDLRSHYMSGSGKWGTYFIDSTQHTWLLGPGFYTTQVNGTKLTQWMRDLLDGAAGNVGP